MHPGRSGEGGGEKRAYLLAVKENQPALKELIEWAFAAYPPTDSHAQQELRSGEVWGWQLEMLPMPEEVSGFAASRLALRMRRSVSRKRTGELREETTYALTSLLAPAGELYALWRGHWEVENRLHHKRDTVLGEAWFRRAERGVDASRSRKGALGLMYLRDVVLNLLHLKKQPVLRSVRRFSANPQALLRLIQRL